MWGLVQYDKVHLCRVDAGPARCFAGRLCSDKLYSRASQIDSGVIFVVWVFAEGYHRLRPRERPARSTAQLDNVIRKDGST
jgi:hypothetical protein